MTNVKGMQGRCDSAQLCERKRLSHGGMAFCRTPKGRHVTKKHEAWTEQQKINTSWIFLESVEQVEYILYTTWIL